MAEHHVEVIEQAKDGQRRRRAWCSTCYWSGPLVKLCSYADRHAEEHRALTRESATTGGEVA